ncbi:MAG: SLOG family protein [Rikenellaceae bacterium]
MTIAFTGHREYDAERTNEALYQRIAEIASQNDDITFLSGMAVGFDLAAAEAVLEVRRLGYNVGLKCIIPFYGQSRFFCESDQTRYNRVVELADEVVILSKSYNSSVFFNRNDFLIDNADTIIAYFNTTKKGGTAYTIRKARRANLKIENLYPTAQLSLF